MNFQQLRYIREAVRCGFNLTDVAATLHTSQPGVSRQVRELEEELGIEIFSRAGKRLTGLTPPGAALLPYVNRLLQEADNIKRASHELQGREDGKLSIAATHSQTRYALPQVVKEFRQRYPSQLSGGQRQRIALARALAVEPQVLLLDEPFGALDALTKMQMQDLLAETTQAVGATVMMVTHDIDEAVYLADRIVILGGKPAQLVAGYDVTALRPRDRSDATLTLLRGKILDHFGLLHHAKVSRDYQI